MPIRALILGAFVCAGTAAAQSAGDERALFDDLPTMDAVSLPAQTLAGAAACIFPDYADLGRLAAEVYR